MKHLQFRLKNKNKEIDDRLYKSKKPSIKLSLQVLFVREAMYTWGEVFMGIPWGEVFMGIPCTFYLIFVVSLKPL